MIIGYYPDGTYSVYRCIHDKIMIGFYNPDRHSIFFVDQRKVPLIVRLGGTKKYRCRFRKLVALR